MDTLVKLIRLGRPLHLVGGFAFHSLGLALAYAAGFNLDLQLALWCQLAISATQVMTHYSNDYFDQDADAAALTPTRWSGGSRILPAGLVRPRSALGLALLAAAIALGATAGLAQRVSDPVTTVALVTIALVLAWSYSAPPLALNRRGLGEVFGALLVPGVTAILGFQVQSGRLTGLAIVSVLPICLFQFAMLLSVNFPDAAGDARVGKRTLVVRYGPGATARLFQVTLGLAYVILPGLVGLGLPVPAAGGIALTMPLAAGQVGRVRRGAAHDPAQWERLAFWSIVLLLAATVLAVVGLWLGRAAVV